MWYARKDGRLCYNFTQAFMANFVACVGLSGCGVFGCTCVAALAPALCSKLDDTVQICKAGWW